jgi:hypothetical protein
MPQRSRVMLQKPLSNILVLGTSRGGTTLLSASLGAHPMIAMLDEDHGNAIGRITGGKIAANKLCVPNQIELTRKWHWYYTPGLSNGFFRKTLFMNKIPKGRLSIIDYDQMGDIVYIGVLRHPAGVLQSIRARENKSLKVACYRWQRCLEVFEHMENSNRYFAVVDFEKLVAQPEETLQAICKWMSLDYDAQMLEGPQRNARYAQEGQSFAKEKAHYENADDIWSHFEKDMRARYESLKRLV